MPSKLTKINSLLLAAVIILGFNTYIVQNKLGFSEFIAEGLPMVIGIIIFAGLIFFGKYDKNIVFDNSYVYYTIIYIIYLIFITSYYIVINDESLLRYIFLYQYLPPLSIMMYANSKYIDINFEFGFFLMAFAASISSVFALGQFFHFIEIVPIDINRARGLSRSTLNYSSLMFLGFLAAWNIRCNFYRFFFMFIIAIGVLCSQSRGALLACFTFIFLISIKKIKFLSPKIIIIFILFLLPLILVLLFLSEFKVYSSASVNELIWRLSNTFNFTSGDNALRSARYWDVINDFHLYGRGVGATGPASGRINPGAVHYESFVLALLVHGGFIGVLYYMATISSILRAIGKGALNIFPYIAAFFVMMTVQQTFETPTVNTMAWLLILLVLTKHLKLNISK
ncbi:hypothetical protein AOC21_01645 [Polynucleobacter sp. VK25]|uniref:hypothetical protein n=1 Tax=Polynucleobacter sp. VK25 TaxID=1758398 RepID=UPI001BFD08F8|nr:hypothetical protein [Polynucleobacter sp. VK25]QWD68642.1 hypothetical protein AOC21_01645 [Polynucleobacter sp. VK25]